MPKEIKPPRQNAPNAPRSSNPQPPRDSAHTQAPPTRQSQQPPQPLTAPNLAQLLQNPPKIDAYLEREDPSEKLALGLGLTADAGQSERENRTERKLEREMGMRVFLSDWDRLWQEVGRR